jgi:cell division septation protein DedD
VAKAKTSPGTPGIYSVTRKGVILWGCVFMLVGAWLFLLGILVGRGLVPQPFELNSFERELEAQRAEEISIAQARLEQDAQEGLPAEPLRIEDLRQPKVDTRVRAVRRESVIGPDGVRLKKRRVPPKPNPLGKAQRPDKTRQRSAVVKATSAASAPVAAATAPKANAKPSRSAAPRGGNFSLAGMKAKFTIQVASVREQAAAERIIKKLKQAGHPAYQTVSPSSSNGIWYRVRVGAYDTRKAAETALGGFKGSGYQPIVIQQ